VNQLEGWDMQYRVPEKVLQSDLVQKYLPEPPERLEFKGFWAIIGMAVLLAVRGWGYPGGLGSGRAGGWAGRRGDNTSAPAVLAVPLYAIMYVAHLVLSRLGLEHLAFVPPIVTAVLVVLWFLGAWRLRRRLSAHDRVAKITHLAHQELVYLNRAREMLQH